MIARPKYQPHGSTTSPKATVSAPVPGRPALRYGPISLVWRPRVLIMSLLLLVTIVLLAAVSIGSGDYPMSAWKVLQVIFFGDGTRLENIMVWNWRMPRAVTGIAVGSALGISGAFTQAITRNALASPDILGITTGASAAAVTVIVLGSGSGLVGWLASFGVPLAALLGAIATALLIWLLAWSTGTDSFRLILVGIIITALLSSYISFLMVRAQLTDAATAQLWLTGSLSKSEWTTSLPVIIAVIVCTPLLAWLGYQLLATALGNDMARALGQRVQRIHVIMLALSVALAAVAVSAAGPIGFVAFVAPQVALRLCNTPTPPLFASALTGAALLLGADVITSTVLPTELPVGIVTSAAGGVFLIYLLIQQNRKTTTS